jgi:hypothetical protein
MAEETEGSGSVAEAPAAGVDLAAWLLRWWGEPRTGHGGS